MAEFDRVGIEEDVLLSSLHVFQNFLDFLGLSLPK